MKTINILTYWGVPNYGAWVQAYALNNTVRTLAGENCNVRHLAYLTDIHWKYYYENDIQLYNAFSYSWEEIPHTTKLKDNELEELYSDVLITGADSIWEFSNKDMGDDFHLIGNNLNAGKIVSYGATFGVTKLTELPSWTIDGLMKYSHITVRDEYSKEIVNSLLPKKECTVVCDPALLYDFKNDSKIKLPQYKDYLAVYGGEFEPDFIAKTIELARKNDLEIISIGYINSWCDRSIRMLELRTLEWLGFIKNATFVVTSMFHGLMTSLSLEKQVKFNQVGYVKNRSQTLLENLDIEDTVKDFSKRLDYQIINPKLEELRQNSLLCLKEII